MRTRRSRALAALGAGLLLTLSAPAAAAAVGSNVERIDGVDTLGDAEQLVEEVEEIVDDLLDEVEGALEDTVGDEDDGDGREEDDEATGTDGGPEGDEADEPAARTTVERATPAEVLPLLRPDRSYQTSLARFRVAETTTVEVEAVAPTLDDVLDPVVREHEDEPSWAPAGEMPVLAAPARAQAVAATPGGLNWQTALGGAALIVLLVSTALLAEIRPKALRSG